MHAHPRDYFYPHCLSFEGNALVHYADEEKKEKKKVFLCTFELKPALIVSHLRSNVRGTFPLPSALFCSPSTPEGHLLFVQLLNAPPAGCQLRLSVVWCRAGSARRVRGAVRGEPTTASQKRSERRLNVSQSSGELSSQEGSQVVNLCSSPVPIAFHITHSHLIYY